MRVSLDTNVRVSALTTRGICADVLAVVLAEHQLVLGEKVLGELRRVLDKKMRMPEKLVPEAQAFLRHEAAVVSQRAEVATSLRDPDDAEVLAEAIGGLADVLVTGDRDLLEVAQQVPIEVLSPRGFGKSFTKRPRRRLLTCIQDIAGVAIRLSLGRVRGRMRRDAHVQGAVPF